MALFSIETHGQLDPHIHQEWLLTNGLGGFAASTVVGCNTRRYHGLLCAATLPPVGRIMTVNRVGEALTLDGKTDELFELSVNQFRERFHPLGDQYLRTFELNDVARWEYNVDGVRVVKELQILWLKNVAMLRYTLESDRPRAVQFSVQPFVSLRDFHSERHIHGSNLTSRPGDRQVDVSDGYHTVSIAADAESFVSAPDWWYGHVYAIETERGMDDNEDLFTPGRFVLDSKTGKATLTLWFALESQPKPDWDAELKRRRAAVIAACTDPENVSAGPSAVCATKSPTIQKLARAANDFIVFRRAPDGSDGTSVIAGYPWFADWGRDTMISLPGLLLTTGRFRQARQVLTVFAKYVSEGMIPNRFDDYNNEPHYNTVDASLWFIHAVFEYLKTSGDKKTFDAALRPACKAIIEGYRKGTRFNIVMDPTDGLITQGDPTTQLTWMDAKTDGTVFTPRQGKAVEINALWYHGLVLMGEKELAAKVKQSFRQAFWINAFRGLYDVVDGTRKDPAVRPNQIFAVSLPNSPLSEDQQHAVVELVRRELLTPAGLRTLSPTNPGYHGRYCGGPYQRDEAYHNGTVWPWLIGPFLSAYLRVYGQSPESQEQARQWLGPLIGRMNEFSIGQIHEICEGDSPHRPAGCPAQAWSVAEVLRLAVELGM
jgi:predicted glycogen debranching enzyme